MKRRVRIYKAGGEHTADLTKAQEGMQMGPDGQKAPVPAAEDIMTYMMQLISNGSSLDDATKAIVNQGVPVDQATMIANQIDAYIQQQADANLAQETGNEDDQEKLALEQQAQEQAAAEEEARSARMQSMYAQDDSDYTGSMEDDSDIYMKLGGVKNKKDYVKHYMSLTKKQMGGGTGEDKPDLQTDIPVDGRTEHLQKFLGAVKTTAQDAVLRKQAEEAYNQQMSFAQNGGMYPTQDVDPENPMHHLGLYSQGLNQVFDNDMLTQAQMGGFTDPESGLYKFFAGGEDPSIPELNQNTIDYTNSKDTTDSYFQYGGYNRYPRIYPRAYGAGRAIQYAGSWDKQKGSPYMTGTNNPYMGQIGPNSTITSIDVKKSGLLGRPKQYTINYSVPGQSGITANKPQSYKGSDGQMHFMNPETPLQQIPGSQDTGAESRLKGMYRRITEKGFSVPEEFTSTGSYDKNDEKYKKIYGHYPGEGQTVYSNTKGLPKGANYTLPEGFGLNPTTTFDYADMMNYMQTNEPLQPDPNEKLKKLYPYLQGLSHLQMGGDLPQAQKLGEFNYSGNDIPFGYFKDPTTGLIKNLAGDIYKPTTNIQGSADKLMDTNSLTSQGNGLTTDKSMSFDPSGEQYRNDGLLSDSEKQQQSSQNVSVDVKRKKMWDVNGPLLNEKINRVGNFGAGILENIGALDANKELYNSFDADRLYAVNQDRDRGTYDTNSGLFRPDEMGFKGVASLGGYMQEGGDYQEDDDTYMSEEEIRQFLADGGDLEFI